jgi:hypothetical protein
LLGSQRAIVGVELVERRTPEWLTKWQAEKQAATEERRHSAIDKLLGLTPTTTPNVLAVPPVKPEGTPAERAAAEWEKPTDVAKATAELAPDTKDGFVPASKLTVAHTSGYTLPATPEGSTFAVSALVLLAQARAAGVSQAQVTAILQAQMKGGA